MGVVANIIGFKLSLIELLFCIPIVFLIAYGVPGIPGELVLFTGPIALCLNLPEAIVPLYLALYSGLQLGLPDSFRSGNNVTDSMLYAALLNDVYEERFLPKARSRGMSWRIGDWQKYKEGDIHGEKLRRDLGSRDAGRGNDGRGAPDPGSGDGPTRGNGKGRGAS